jgi:hypothetical protein
MPAMRAFLFAVYPPFIRFRLREAGLPGRCRALFPAILAALFTRFLYLRQNL